MSHYSIGSTTYIHKGKEVKSIVGNSSAENFITKSDYDRNSSPGTIPIEYEHRPDLIANLFLDNPDDLWFICLLSNKYDVFEDFGKSERISLPK